MLFRSLPGSHAPLGEAVRDGPVARPGERRRPRVAQLVELGLPSRHLGRPALQLAPITRRGKHKRKQLDLGVRGRRVRLGVEELVDAACWRRGGSQRERRRRRRGRGERPCSRVDAISSAVGGDQKTTCVERRKECSWWVLRVTTTSGGVDGLPSAPSGPGVAGTGSGDAPAPRERTAMTREWLCWSGTRAQRPASDYAR